MFAGVLNSKVFCLSGGANSLVSEARAAQVSGPFVICDPYFEALFWIELRTSSKVKHEAATLVAGRLDSRGNADLRRLG
jgi:hypothetical protein